jgi:glycosyltransferase involved in cell wall biosynthesis
LLSRSVVVRILLSALACEPGIGSEYEVGFRAMLGAASRHDVWVLTASESIPSIRKALRSDPRAGRIRLEGIRFGLSMERALHLNAAGYVRRYDRWQGIAGSRSVELDREVDFDLIHHVTLSSYWTRAGVAKVGKPLVWGPVGGGVDPPLPLVSELGSRGMLEAAVRVLGRPVIARLPAVRKTQQLAMLILAQNRDTKQRLRSPAAIRVLSNALAIELDGVSAPPERGTDLLFVGRLLAWKAPILALRAFRHIKHPDIRLRFCGEGPEAPRIERAAHDWGLADRVRFEGWLRREDLLSLVASAGAVIHPAVHEEAGLSVAEALSLGTPVICLNHGGPAELVRQWPDSPSVLIPPESAEATARSIAAAIDRFLLDPPPTVAAPVRATTSFQEELLRCYEWAARRAELQDRPASGHRRAAST